MNRRELRPGNIVHSSLDTTEGERLSIVTIRCIHMNVAETEESGTWQYSKIKPIPLTEEWLVRLGCEESNDRFKCGSFYLFFDGKEWSVWLPEPVEQDVFLCTVNFVHEVQNLYFAIEKEELTTKQ